MNLLALPPILSAVFALGFGFFILSNRPYSAVKRSFALLCFETFYWHSCWFATYYFDSPNERDLIMRLAWSGITFIPITNYQFAIEFLNIKKERKIVYCLYIVAAMFLVPLWTTNWFISGARDFWFGYYPAVGPLHLLYLVIVVGFLLRSVVLLLRALNEPGLSGVERNRKRFAFICHATYFCTSLEYLINYGVPLYPVGAITMPAAFCVMVYAVTRYQLLDVEVLVKRTAVFAGLFAFVYGVFSVFTIIGKRYFEQSFGWNEWISMIPTVFIIMFVLRPMEDLLTNATEKYLFQKKYDYKHLLKTFTSEVLTVLDLQELATKTVDGLARIIKLESCGVFILNEEADVDENKAYVGMPSAGKALVRDNLLIYYLSNSQGFLCRALNGAQKNELLINEFKRLNASLCLAIMLNDKMIGIITLGEKKSGEEYTPEDIDVLSSLARTEAIAISNAQLFRELSATQAEAAQKEKMAVVGTLAAGINHEICNPLGIARGQCEMFLLNYRDGIYKDVSEKELIDKCVVIYEKVINEIDRATGITKRLSSFAKPSKKFELGEVKFAHSVNEVLAILGYELRLDNIQVVTKIPETIPFILGDKKQIEEIIFNIVRNAAQAIAARGSITISAHERNGRVVVDIEDTGSGIPADKINQIFNPFYTTKAPGKGTGLGLFIVKQIVERNRGTIAVKSQIGTGTIFTLSFEIAKQPVAA